MVDEWTVGGGWMDARTTQFNDKNECDHGVQVRVRQEVPSGAHQWVLHAPPVGVGWPRGGRHWKLMQVEHMTLS